MVDFNGDPWNQWCSKFPTTKRVVYNQGAEAARQGQGTNACPYNTEHFMTEWCAGFRNELNRRHPQHDYCDNQSAG